MGERDKTILHLVTAGIVLIAVTLDRPKESAVHADQPITPTSELLRSEIEPKKIIINMHTRDFQPMFLPIISKQGSLTQEKTPTPTSSRP